MILIEFFQREPEISNFTPNYFFGGGGGKNTSPMTDVNLKIKNKIKNQPNKLQACDQHFSQREFNGIASTAELSFSAWEELNYSDAWICMNLFKNEAD